MRSKLQKRITQYVCANKKNEVQCKLWQVIINLSNFWAVGTSTNMRELVLLHCNFYMQTGKQISFNIIVVCPSLWRGKLINSIYSLFDQGGLESALPPCLNTVESNYIHRNGRIHTLTWVTDVIYSQTLFTSYYYYWVRLRTRSYACQSTLKI